MSVSAKPDPRAPGHRPAPGRGRAAGFGVYIHWPFCQAKCPYCDFNSHVRSGGIDQARFCAAYLRELEHMAARMPGEMVTSVFFGGGTPSLMSPDILADILDGIARLWPLDSNVEVTIEANPSSVEANRFAGYRAAGVNRASLGIQALDDRHLKALGRLHSVDEALKAIDIARRSFERISFDLIYARPGQTPPDWQSELRRALELQAGHLSLYQLTIEPGTAFAALHAAGRLRLPDDDVQRDLFEATQDICSAAGLPAYEISNHAHPGAECQHNLVYWRYGPYVGVGPGAHGRLAAGSRRIATACEPNPEAWLAAVETRGHGIADEAEVLAGEQADEILLMGLRLREGVALDHLRSRTGYTPDPDTLKALAGEGLVIMTDDNHCCTTAEGRFVLNDIVLELSENLVSLPVEPAGAGEHSQRFVSSRC